MIALHLVAPLPGQCTSFHAASASDVLMCIVYYKLDNETSLADFWMYRRLQERCWQGSCACGA
jgi:hypothetical protein